MPKTTALRITTSGRVYLIITLFVTLIFCLVLLTQVQMDTLSAIRAYVGAEGLWAKAQKDAVHNIEHYVSSHDEADYLAYRRQIQVPLGDRKARIELQKKNPDITVVQEGFIQERNHPDDVESAFRFFRRFQHSAYMSQVIVHWTTGDRMITELDGVAEALHKEIASGRNNPETIRSYLTRLDDIDRQVTVVEDLFSFTLAEASRRANDVSRNLAYGIAFLFVILGIGLSWPIITRIRRTENAFLESEGRYRSIFEKVGDVIYTIEADGRFSSLSPSFERLTGWLPAEWIGRPFADIVHPDDLPQAFEIFQKTMFGESTTNFEARINKKSGAYFDAEHSIVPILVSEKPVVLLGIARDITERKLAENAMHESAASLKALVEYSPIALIVDVGVDADEKIMMMNQQFTELFGYTMEDVPDVHHWWPLAYPDEKYRKELMVEWIRRVEKAIQSHGAIEPMQATVTCKDGSIRYVRISLAAIGNRNIITFEDLTESKLAEDTIRQQQELTTQIIETIPLRVFWKDRDLRYLGCNTLFAKDAGLTRPDELIGKTDFDMGWKDQAEIYRADDRRVMASNTPKLSFDEPQTTQEGGHIWLRTSKVPLRSEINETIGLLGVYEDITDYKQVELSLLESEERFRKAFQYSAIGMALVGLDGHWLKVNNSLCQIVGYSEQELLNKTFQDITYPDDLQSDLEFMAQLLAGEIDHYQMEKRYFHKDGHVVWIRLSVSLIRDAQDNPIHLVSQIEDITEDKLAAETLRKTNIELGLFRKLLDNSSDAIEVIDPITARFLDVNERACRDLGYSREELLSMNVFDIDPSINPDTKKMIEEQMQKSGTTRFEGVHRRKDGATFAVEVSIGTADLDKPYWLCVVRDITERKLAEEKIRKLNEELEAKVQERTKQLRNTQEELVRKGKLAVLGQIAGSVGHELRNPLGVMSNAVYFLQTVLADANETIKEYLNIIKDEIAGSERIVSDLLDSVRTNPPQIQMVGIAELIEQILSKYTVPSSVTMKLDIPATLPPLRVDAMQIQQVFRNLICNGVEAMPKGGTLEIQAIENTQDGTVTVSVCDSGIGMAPEILVKLFQPLFTTKARGIGLGLVVVKNLTQANGGRIEVHSEPGKGTTFAVILPT
jgi:PAS domain S-box-containing protein